MSDDGPNLLRLINDPGLGLPTEPGGKHVSVPLLRLIVVGAGTLSLVVGVSAALWSLAGRGSQSFAPVLEAVSTLAAVVAAAIAAIYAANAFRIETRRDTQRDADRRRHLAVEIRQQASLVRLTPVSRRLHDKVDGDWVEFAYGVKVHNRSSDAVHDVELMIEIEPADVVRLGFDSLTVERIAVLASDEQREVWITTRIDWDNDLKDAESHEGRASVRFTDINLLGWARDHEHRLRNVTPASRTDVIGRD